MESNMNYESRDHPIQCANGCGFFGTRSTMNMCSKCYNDHRLKEEQSATVRAVVRKSLTPSLKEKSSEAAAAAKEEEVVDELKKDELKKVVNRCGSCNKKVGMVGFKCRCGITFCGSHRYPEEHKCMFDYKVVGKEAIAKANPLVVADKVRRI